jgi:hypothetical protein
VGCEDGLTSGGPSMPALTYPDQRTMISSAKNHASPDPNAGLTVTLHP